MPKIRVNDIDMYYEEYGHGEPLVLVAGFCADHKAWLSVVRLFAQNYRVIIFDNRGAGQTDCPATPYTIDLLTADVVALCKQLGITKAHFIGNSMGGFIVQNLAYKYPELIKSVVISNSFAKTNTRIKLQVESRLPLFQFPIAQSDIIRNILPWLYSVDFLEQEGMVESLVDILLADPYPITELGYRNQLHALLAFDSRAWLSKITVASLVVYADDDLYVTLAGSRLLYDSIPRAESYCFHNVGHLPHIEQPENFYAVVNQFLSQH